MFLHCDAHRPEAASALSLGAGLSLSYLYEIPSPSHYALEMSDFLMESELTETKAFIQYFVKEIAVAPGQAIVRYAMTMPEDSPIGRRESEVVRIGGQFWLEYMMAEENYWSG